MENASKALIMAGAVLIALMVIALLVFFFNNIRDLQKTNLTSEEVEQATEFNKQYDVYARDVYGSELLSLANKVVDYNERESDNKGYTKIELEVYFEKSLDINNKYFKTNEVYTAERLYKETADKSNKDSLEKYVEELGNEKIYSTTNTNISRKISKLATMRTNDIEALGITNYSQKLQEYNNYKNLLSQMKQTVFKYINFDYDKNTGRIIKMSYKLPK